MNPLGFREITADGTYWMYSKRGPDDNRKLGSYQLREGILTVPVPGDVARMLIGRGLQAVQATVESPDLVPDAYGGWEVPDAAPSPPVVADRPPYALPSLDGVEAPDKLPDEYMALMAMYTKAGNRRKR